jgi:hypothetical protein
MSSIYGDELISQVGTVRYYYTFRDYLSYKNSSTIWPSSWTTVFINSHISQLTRFDEITGSSHSIRLLNDYLVPKYHDDIVRISVTDLTKNGTIAIKDADATTVEDLFLDVDMKLWYTLAKTYDKYNFLLQMYDAQLATLFDGVNKTIYNNVADTQTDSGTNNQTVSNVVSQTTSGTSGQTDSGTNNQTSSIGARDKKTRTNDTPQNGGSWEDDKHTSEFVEETDAAAQDTLNGTTSNTMSGTTSGKLDNTTSINTSGTTSNNNSNIKTGSIDIAAPSYEKFEKIQNMIRKVYDDWTSEFEKCFYDIGGIE